MNSRSPTHRALHWFTTTGKAVLILWMLLSRTTLHAAETPPLRTLLTVREVTSLQPDDAMRHHPVQVRGVVTFVSDQMKTLFVQDPTDGVFVDSGLILPTCRMGDEVSITGISEPGAHKPVIALQSLRVLGRGNLPPTNRVALDALWSGRHDCTWVTVRGHVRGHQVDGEFTALFVGEANRAIEVWVRDLPQAFLPLLNFAEVEFTGTTSVEADGHRGVENVYLWLSSTNQVRVLRSASQLAASLPQVSLASFTVTNASLDPARPLRVQGTVTHASRRFGVQLQEGDACVTVMNYEDSLPRAGQAIEAIGWPRRTNGAAHVIGANVRILGTGLLPKPDLISLQTARGRIGDNRLVIMEGILRHRVSTEGENRWIVEQDNGYFEAYLPAGLDDLHNPIATAGTTLRLTGVLHTQEFAGGKAAEPMLLLRSPADIEILSAPPWPTARVLEIVLITLALHAVGLLALAALYFRLRRRSADLATTRTELETANRELEHRVATRTATLTAANEALSESESRFRQLTTHIDEIFWMSTPDNKELLYLSPSFEKVCGRPVEEVYRAPDQWFQLVHPDDRERVHHAAFARPVVNGYEVEYRIVRPDGTVRWLNDRAFPIRDEAGNIFRVAGIAEDITASKQAEVELHDQHIALSNAMPGIARLTNDGHYTSVNSHYAHMQGYEPGELVGLHFSGTVHPEDMLTITHAYERMVTDGKAEAEIRGVRKDRSVYWKQVLQVRITDADGSMNGFRCFIRDITSRKKDELLLEGQKAVLETIADGAPLRETLDTLARFIQSQAPDCVVSILLASEDGTCLRSGAAPSFPEALNKLIDGLPIAPNAGTCGACAHHRHRVTATDIATSPLLVGFDEHFSPLGLFACTSTPILSSNGAVLGVFGIFIKARREPTSEEDHLIHLATQLAAIAIERDQTQRAERLAQERYRSIVDNATDAVITIDDQRLVQVFNHAAEAMFGCTATDAANRPFESFIAPAGRTALPRQLQIIAAPGVRPGLSIPLTGLRCGGGEFPIEASLSQSTVNGRPVITAIFRDLTEKHHAERTREQLEIRLRQSQKMEAIGTLAGGIAHDFNNILGAVMLNIELARGEVPDGHPAQEYLTALRASSLRARDLVRQILAFSRQQAQQRHVLRLERVVQEALKLVRAALPSTIEINLRLSSDGPSILADSTQIHQILANLSANAAHAMRERGGHLDLRQRTLQVDATLAATSPDLQPGRYVELTVADTGSGMSPETLERIFDPFFTTKGPGEGTGLGLAVVHGIMKEHDGAILVDSTPGQGTTFRLYFPAVELPETTPDETPEIIPRGQGERLLILDDEEALLRVNQRTLERLGYHVTAHTIPSVALAAFRDNPEQFDLVITDLAMPGMTGMDFSRELLRLRPGCPVVLTTGYTSSLDPQNIKSLGLAGLLFKPATAAVIGETVHHALRSIKSM
jgi:PAS domain S-box-containing protein